VIFDDIFARYHEYKRQRAFSDAEDALRYAMPFMLRRHRIILKEGVDFKVLEPLALPATEEYQC
jgi:hypothetical protein